MEFWYHALTSIDQFYSFSNLLNFIKQCLNEINQVQIDKKKFKGYTTPLVIANIHYIMTKFGGKKKSIENIRKLRKIISILSIDEEIVDEALLSDNAEFEDAIQYIASEKNNIVFIITRNKGDFKKSKLPVLNADEFLRIKK